ncbi:ABC transporter ATP-binding protein, partial [Bacteroides xylanisolvens]
LLGQIAYVPQNNFLFSTSIGKNIAFSSEKANKSDVASAAEKSDLHDDVLQMPKGYETLVGENGISLSGGQRQRMS